MVLGDPKVQKRALKLANQAMREDVLPFLQRRHPRPNSWNPLRSDVKGDAPYVFKLWLQDALVMEILKSNDLMQKTEECVIWALEEAATVYEPKAFVTNILEHLMCDG